MKVLNFGSMNLDYVYAVEHFVKPGETISALRQSVNPGGKGLNQSVALSRAGAPVCHAGCVGAGGERLVEILDANGVDTSCIRRSDALQGNAIIQVAEGSGENCIILFPGSNRQVTEAQVDETLARFDAGDYLVLQNEINALPYIVDRAYEKGMVIVLNPSPYDEKIAEIDLSKISWLFVNEVEAAGIAGSEDPERAWTVLHDLYPKLSVLITLGSEGSVAYRVAGNVHDAAAGGQCSAADDAASADVDSAAVECVYQEVFPVQAVDTTAAGDTYTGFFITALIEGKSLKECMRLAGMASAMSVTRPGAAESIPSRAEVEEALAKL